MEARYISAGNTISHIPSAALSAGTVVVLGNLVAVATYPVEANQSCALTIQGVFEFEKTNTAMTTGTVVYWDNTAKVATTTQFGNTLLGKVVRDAAASDTKVRVLLTP